MATTTRNKSSDDWAMVERANRFALAWKAYKGQLPKPLKVKKGQRDDNVRVNPCKVICDKGVSFLFGKEIKFELNGDDSVKDEAEQWLDGFWKHNKKMTFLHNLALNGAVCGQVFVQIVPAEPYPRLINLDPAMVDVVCSPDDIEQVCQYKIQYPISGGLYRKLIELVADASDSRFDYWHIKEQRKLNDNKDWETLNEVDWPYSWPPILSCQNLPMPNELWGCADLDDDIIEANKSLNFILSNTSRIITIHAHPKTWLRGADMAVPIPNAPDDTILLKKESEVGIVEASGNGIAASMEFAKLLSQGLHETARLPEIATGKLENVGALSGLALSILYQPLIEKTNTKRLTYSDMLTELIKRVLELRDVSEPGHEYEVTVIWPDLLPKDMLVERQTAQADRALGIVSKETVATKLGYDYQLEVTRLANEQPIESGITQNNTQGDNPSDPT